MFTTTLAFDCDCLLHTHEPNENYAPKMGLIRFDFEGKSQYRGHAWDSGRNRGARFRRAPRAESGLNKIVSELPHRAGKLAAIREHVVQCIDEHVDLALADDERWQNLHH